MGSDWNEWLNLAVRWFHVLAGITWIGQTYLFNWFERHLTPDPDDKPNVAGRLWMVHGGGFYLVEKQKVPELMPRTLHWFKWESALTWISGFLLLFIVFYTRGLMVDFDSDLGHSAGVAIGLGSLVAGWLVYDLLWSSPLGKNEPLGAAICYLLAVGAAYLLCRYLNTRAAFLQLGAMFGTIMAANVWMRILPAQDQMLAAVKQGRKPDMRLAARAKQCSKHNTFMSVPLVFLMLSNHFPFVFAHPCNWMILAALILLGFGAAQVLRKL
jgi:uncharacterized membrane protein